MSTRIALSDREIGKLLAGLFCGLFLSVSVNRAGGQAEVFRPKIEPPRPAAERIPGVDPLDPNEAAARRLGNRANAPDHLVVPVGVLDPHIPGERVSLLPPHQLSLFGGYADPVRRSQQRLHELGYLRSTADVDGRMGPKTRLAAREFQSASGLKITGELDLPTRAALHSLSLADEISPEGLIRLDSNSTASERHARSGLVLQGLDAKPFDFHIAESYSPDSIRYQLLDTSNKVIGQSLDQAALAAKLSEVLNASGGKAISIEMPELTQNGADALASSLTIQLRQVDPSLALTAPLLFMPADERLSTTPGLWIQSRHVVVEKIADNGGEKFRSSVSFSVVVANRFRNFTLSIVHSSLNVILDFLDRLGILQRSPTTYEAVTLRQLVDRARADVKRAHPGLSADDLQLMIIDQAGRTGLVELRIETQFAWS